MFYQHNMDPGAWVFMVLANVVIWGLIIAFIIWLVQDLRTRPHRHHTASGASAPRSSIDVLPVARSTSRSIVG